MKIEVVLDGQVIDTKEFGEGSYKIGRVAASDIQLKSPNVSKQHALLVIKGNKAAIVDLGSSNGIFVNGILIRKQRVDPGDDIAISTFKIRIAPNVTARPKGQRPERTNVHAVDDGNLARNLNYHSETEAAPPIASPQERLILLMDQKVLAPYYKILKIFDWRAVLLAILGGALVSAVLASVVPIVRWGKGITTKEALARAHTVVGQTVRENYRIITKTNDFNRLTVEAAEAEQGILSVFIIDPKANGILAPTKLLSKPVTDIHTLIAIKKIIQNKEDIVSEEKEDGLWVIAQPIYVFSQEANDRILQAVVVAEFEVPTKVYSTFEPLMEAALIAVLLSLMAFFLISKMFTYPIATMQEQLDAALKGEEVTVTAEAKSPELESLATVINFSLSRIKQGGGPMVAPVGAADAEAAALLYVRTVEEFDSGTSDALLLLDQENKVKYVGRALEELLGMRNTYAQGQNISDACRDASFAGTAIDMADKVKQTLGETQNSLLDINGISRNLFAVGHKDAAGEISFVLVTVKLGGG